MTKKVLFPVILGCFLASLVLPAAAQGFDTYGYNYKAEIFNGTYENWYRQKTGQPPWQEGDPYITGIFATAHLIMKWDKLWNSARFGGEYWHSGAWCTNDYRWTDPDTGTEWHWYYRFVVAPLNQPPSEDAEDVGWGHPVAEDETVLCFWAIFRIESGTGPYLGPAAPNGFGAYK